MKKKIVVVNYGLGNIRSAEQSLKRVIEENNLQAEVNIINTSKEVNSATHIILPGQGAFASCMKGLINIPGMVEELSESVLIQKKPFLGICIGMQLLANTGNENGIHKGLGWINGEIKRLPQKNIKLPHMGWNEVSIKKDKNELMKDENENNYYFVHSYFFDCKSRINEVATTKYGIDFASIISKENIYGVQFHPEKSSRQGLRILKNFVNL
jgi:glutamine amidotransferase